MKHRSLKHSIIIVTAAVAVAATAPAYALSGPPKLPAPKPVKPVVPPQCKTVYFNGESYLVCSPEELFPIGPLYPDK